jgi:hypothetical protein
MMRRSTRSELNKLRELVRFLMRDKNGKVLTCYFCHKPLIDDDHGKHDGTGRAAPISNPPTIHHKDVTWRQYHANKTLAHPLCHRRHEAKLVLHGNWRKLLHGENAKGIISIQKKAA